MGKDYRHKDRYFDGDDGYQIDDADDYDILKKIYDRDKNRKQNKININHLDISDDKIDDVVNEL